MFELTPFVRKNNLSAYNPFKELEDFENSFFGKSGFVNDFKTDIRDNGKEYILEADLPGFKKEDINVDIEDNYLTIMATRKNEKDEKDDKGNYIKCERSYGSFQRSFDISSVKSDSISAEYTDGVLKLIMPKKEEVIPVSKHLEIK